MDKCTKCRKFGVKLFLKGERCNTPKCAITRRNYQPGSHGAKKTTRRKSEYGLQLVEKQKAKADYGLRERQFARIFGQASKSKENTGEELFRLLEKRVDNVVYRLGWAPSRVSARQLVTHRKIQVNGKLLSIPSAELKPKDVITPAKKEVIKPVKVGIPAWLKLDEKALKAEIVREPVAEDFESDIDAQLIIEFYSR